MCLKHALLGAQTGAFDLFHQPSPPASSSLRRHRQITDLNMHQFHTLPSLSVCDTPSQISALGRSDDKRSTLAPCVTSESPSADTPTPSFPQFGFLPPELRRAIWRWLLTIEQGGRVLNKRRFPLAHPVLPLQQRFLPSASLVSPLLSVDRESRGERL